LRSLLRSETTIGWKIAPEVPVAGDEIETGTGYLSELSSTYAFDSVGTFTGTIQPFGTPTLQIQAGLAVGDAYEGGIIAWLTGDNQNGIIITGNSFGGFYTPDFAGLWSTPDNNVTGASGLVYGTGTANTALIVANTASSMALDCSNLTSGGFSDWVLPSLEDMDNILTNGVALNIVNGTYWTSTENDATTVKCLDWTGTTTPVTLGKSLFLEAFAVRYF
jgi:hypothetical protein